MRKQIAAANWKMNLTYSEAADLLGQLLPKIGTLSNNREVVLAVPAPYLKLAKDSIENAPGIFVAAQNVFTKKSGAYTGEVSVLMLKSMGISHAIIGHSERREYFSEDNAFLAQKVNLCLEEGLTPIFCCGESLPVREEGGQNDFVARQIHESLFHLGEADIQKVVIAYEPIWAIGTGKTASSDQAQEMHAHIRGLISEKYGSEIGENISILYGGSVKGSNAAEIFGKPDVDGGLVGGASLVAEEFLTIIRSLK